jgi:hypothetical protein
MGRSLKVLIFVSILSPHAMADAKDPSCDSVAKSATVSQSNYNFVQHRKMIDEKERLEIQAITSSKENINIEDVKKIRQIMIDKDKEREVLRSQSKSQRSSIYENAYKYCLGVPLLEEKQIQTDMASSAPRITTALRRPVKDYLSEVVAEQN